MVAPPEASRFSLNTVAVAGDSGEWAVWAQRDWEVGVLAGSFGQGSRVVGAPSYGADIDLEQIRSPSGWGMPLTADQKERFRRNFG